MCTNCAYKRIKSYNMIVEVELKCKETTNSVTVVVEVELKCKESPLCAQIVHIMN